jgi:hypothetical protein
MAYSEIKDADAEQSALAGRAASKLKQIDIHKLDAEISVFEAFLRSLRLLRAFVGSLTGSTIIIVVMLPTIPIIYAVIPAGEKISETTFAIIVVVALPLFTGLLLAILHLYFYLFRRVAAGSVRAIRLALVIGFFMAVMQAVMLMRSAVDLWLSPSASILVDEWSPRPVLSLILIFRIVPVYVSYLFVVGLIRVLGKRKSDYFSVLVDQSFGSRFWPGFRSFVSDFWRVMGIPVPPVTTRLKKRVTVAAVCAFALEGMSISWYVNQSKDIADVRQELLKGQISEISMFFGFLALFAICAAAIWASFAISRKLRRYARHHSLHSAEVTRLIDQRKPVLFLRCFADDQVSLEEARMPWLTRFFDPGVVAGTLEEILLWEFSYLGPAVAVGRPDEELPPLGAARRYCAGTEWHDVVSTLMDESSLIIVGMGRSRGLAWEIDQIFRKDLLEKTVFVMPPGGVRDRPLLEQMLQQLGVEHPPRLAPAQGVLTLSFPEPDRGLLLTSSSARLSESQYRLALRATRLSSPISMSRGKTEFSSNGSCA